MKENKNQLASKLNTEQVGPIIILSFAVHVYGVKEQRKTQVIYITLMENLYIPSFLSYFVY